MKIETKRALISVYDKEGLESVARKLKEKGWDILSTGGTSGYLREKGIEVLEVSEITKFPEILDGRVKTLHPLVFAPILAKNTPDHLRQLWELSIPRIELLIVNFYPFAEALQQEARGIDFMVENIDIGGPSMVRPAAKNFKNTIVVVDREDYQPVVDKLLEYGDIDLEERKALAQKAFSYTSFYDSLIAGYLHEGQHSFPPYLAIAGKKTMDLRYGENPHQKGALYIRDPNSPLHRFEQIQGKELSFNNILDFSMVYEVLNWFRAVDSFYRKGNK
jgi:phosphoribosylaminoimidazolecarboxamide formyltransferase/IMP cyclohydrolase